MSDLGWKPYMPRFAPVMLVFLALVAPAASAEPLVLRAAVAAAKSGCVAEGGRPAPGRNFIRQVEINGDRMPAWVLDYSFYVCRSAGASHASCGPLGCRLQVFLSNGKGQYEAAFDGRVTAWRLHAGHAGRQLQVSRARAYCGAGLRGGCGETFEPQGAALFLVARRNQGFRRETDVATNCAAQAAPRQRIGTVPLAGHDRGDSQGQEPVTSPGEDLVTFPVSRTRLNEIRGRQKRLRLPVQ